MTNWPTATVDTANVDDGGDNPRTARADIADAFGKLNKIIEGPALFETRAGLNSATVPTNVPAVRTTGYTTKGDGGHAGYIRVGAEPSHEFKVSSNGATIWWEGVPDDGIRATQVGAIGDDSTNNATALANWLGSTALSRRLLLPEGIFQTGTALSVSDGPICVLGHGWHEDASGALLGSVLKAASTAVADLLTIQSSSPGSGAATDIRGLEVADLSLVHRGTGTGLKIDNVVYPRISNVNIDCNQEGAIGLEFDNWGFFAVIEKCRIRNATSRCVIIDGDGSQHILRDCHISSDQTSDAPAALEIRRFDFLVDGGQYNSNRSTDDGIGILVNNTDGSATRTGGRIVNTLCENDVAVKITGDTFAFTDVIIERPFWSMAQLAKGVIFDRATRCLLIEPHVRSPTGGGTLAEWTANSVDCGVICGREGARAPVTVDANATRAWKRVTGRHEYSDRTNFTTDANLTVIVDDIVEIGRTVHNGTAWDKYNDQFSLDEAKAYTPPNSVGTVRVSSRDSYEDYVEARYAFGVMEALHTTGKTAVDTTSGTLTGTSGVSGEITIRSDGTGEQIYVENRRSSRALLVEFI